MKKMLSRLLLASALLCSAPLHAGDETACAAAEFKQADSAWAGHYYLNGVMEVGSELLLKPDGTFKWYLAVGSLDQYAEGAWWKNGACIGLKAAPQYVEHLEIFPARLNIREKNLDVTWPDGRQDGSYAPAGQ